MWQVTPADIQDLKDLSGRDFEAVIYDLAAAEAICSGIPLGNVKWDRRTNRADGGRDVVVEVGEGKPTPMIPRFPMWFSAKSGDAGPSCAALKKELEDPAHQPLRDHLKAGGSLTWCALKDADDQQKKKLRTEADRLAGVFGFAPELIRFLWNESIKTLLEAHFVVAVRHISRLRAASKFLLTVDQWRRLDPRGGPWVEFVGRAPLLVEIQRHLFSRGDSNWLHIGGISGVGKSRLIRRAIELFGKPEIVAYCADLDLFLENVAYQLQQGEVSACIVLDDVPLERIQAVESFARLASKNVRVISAGIAPPAEVSDYPNVRILNSDERQEPVVAEVLKAAFKTLSPAAVEEIVKFSAHDLHLALLLGRAESEVEVPKRVVAPMAFINAWAKIMRLLGPSIGDVKEFEKVFSRLSAFVDVGFQNKPRLELESLAKFHDLAVADFDAHIDKAASCGLGSKGLLFYEPIPRALAVHAFESSEKARLFPDLKRLFAEIPDRLQRKFLARCGECSEKTRREVTPLLAGYFRERLGPPGVDGLIAPVDAKAFRMWAELDHAEGLDWLVRTLSDATPESIKKLRGSEGIGPWGARREVVFLCEDLAAFPENFTKCEEVLWLLAAVETEERVSNSSSGVWKTLFRPLLSGTAIPFPRRFDRLLSRLDHAEGRRFTLVLEAALDCLEGHVTGRVGPRVVGGKLAPAQWAPKNRGEHGLQVQAAMRAFLSKLESITEPRRTEAILAVVEHKERLLSLDLEAEVGRLILPALSGGPLRDRIIGDLSRSVRLMQEGAKVRGEGESEELKIIKRWLDSVAPSTLEERLRHHIVSFETDPWMENPAGQRLMDQLATDVLANPTVLDAQAEVGPGVQTERLASLAEVVSQKDMADVLWPRVANYLRTGVLRPFAMGYLYGRRRRSPLPGSHPVQVLLDELATSQPLVALMGTVNGDISAEGRERVFRLIPHLGEQSEGLSEVLLQEWWSEMVGESEVLTYLAILRREWEKPGADWAWRSALLAISRLVRRKEVPDAWNRPALAEELRALLDNPRRAEGQMLAMFWLQAFGLLTRTSPSTALRTGFLVLTRENSPAHQVEQSLERDLVELVAQHPEEMLRLIDEALADGKRRYKLDTLDIWDLLEVVPLGTLQAWLRGGKEDRLLLVARHVPKPSIDPKGGHVVAPVTAWLLTEYENDEKVFRAFESGTGVFSWVGGANEIMAKANKNVRPFLDHPIRRVREWAERELKRNESHADWSRRNDEEFEHN